MVLPVLKWLLGEFERGILASIDCDAMNALKRVIRRGKKLLILINSYYKNKGGDVWLKESELRMIVRACNNMHLRLPFWEFMLQRNREYLSWRGRTLSVLHLQGADAPHSGSSGSADAEKVSVDVLDRLVEQYKELRILSKHGDALKSYLVPIRRWIESAQRKLTEEEDQQQLHGLLVEFERYTAIITDPPPQYVALLQRLGISSWINEVYSELNAV